MWNKLWNRVPALSRWPEKQIHWRVIQEHIHQIKGTCVKVQGGQSDIFHGQAPDRCTPGSGRRLQGQGHCQHQRLPDQTSEGGCPYQEVPSTSAKWENGMAPATLVQGTKWNWERLRTVIVAPVFIQLGHTEWIFSPLKTMNIYVWRFLLVPNYVWHAHFFLNLVSNAKVT